MRKTKLTTERKELLLQEIEDGSTRELAARLAGISEQTLYNWIKRGREYEPDDSLDRMKKGELVKRARGQGITGAAKLTKTQLIDKLEESERIYQDFYFELQRAEARAMKKHIKNIVRAGTEDWKASAWYLERRDPDNWGRRDRVHLDNQHSGTIETKETQETKIEIIQKLENDPELQQHYLAILEREQIINGSD